MRSSASWDEVEWGLGVYLAHNKLMGHDEVMTA